MKIAMDHEFLKMNGLGNDFVIVDARVSPFAPSPDEIRHIADRHAGIGCDQLIILEASARADLFMRILNADGGEVDACGNATRCVARLAMDEAGASAALIETAAGILSATRLGESGGVSVDMGPPRFDWRDVPLASPFDDTRHVAIDVSGIDNALPHFFHAVSMGNPHAIFFVERIDDFDLARIGPTLETHALFPQRANISLVEIKSRDRLRQKVWERGAGLTMACGTGACAAAVAAIREGFADPSVTVSLPGGDLQIEWQDGDDGGHVIMTGPVSFEFEGRLSDYAPTMPESAS